MRIIFSPYLARADVSSQANWVKVMTPIADWLLHVGGEDVVDCIRRLEAASGKGKVSPYAFKAVEMLNAGEDFKDFTMQLKSTNVKATQSRVQSLVRKYVRHRWWTWLLLHPELDPKLIHESRRVFRFALSVSGLW